MAKKLIAPDVATPATPVCAPIDFDAATASALFVISTANQDRDGDIVIPEGCIDHLDSYKANPVILFDHGLNVTVPIAVSEDPATKVCTVNVQPDRITARAFFHCDTLESAQICRLVDKRVLRGASIGFKGLKARPVNPQRSKAGSIIEEWEMVEWSIVPVPANGEALRMALGTKWEGKALAEPIATRFKSLLPAKKRTIVSMSVKSGESPRKKAMADETTVDTTETGSDEQDSALLAGAQGVKLLLDGLQAAVAAVEEVQPTIENDKVIKLLEKCIGKIKSTSSDLQNAAAAIYPDVFEAIEAAAEEESSEEEEMATDEAETTADDEDKGGETDEEEKDDISNVDKSLASRQVKSFQKDGAAHIATCSDAAELLEDMSKSPNIPTGYKRQCKGVLPGITGIASWIKGMSTGEDPETEAKADDDDEAEVEKELTDEEEAEALKALKALNTKAAKNAKELTALRGGKA